MGYNANLQWYCSQADSLRLANQQHWTIVGEFTRKSLLTPYSCMRLTSAAANTDCAKWLNGRGTGARYDNTLDWAQRWVLVLSVPALKLQPHFQRRLQHQDRGRREQVWSRVYRPSPPELRDTDMGVRAGFGWDNLAYHFAHHFAETRMDHVDVED
jgi:hypothetical protein